ncbi:MAG: single-stranded DNA-binding protein [Alphaproteobacteria bacterium]|nr:single-stranded DNA-binding protein [Alphaproteobacteria bacterium]
MYDKCYEYENCISVEGIVTEGLTRSHEAFGRVFYKGTIDVPRLSGYVDMIPFICQDSMLSEAALKSVFRNAAVRLEGEIRTYKMPNIEYPRLMVAMYVRSFQMIGRDNLEQSAKNSVILSGAICQNPIFRHTALGRDVCELKIAVARAVGQKSDYIPCIAWAGNAKEAAAFTVGTYVRATGRFQSRPYTKDKGDGKSEQRCAYEVSLFRLSRDS